MRLQVWRPATLNGFRNLESELNRFFGDFAPSWTGLQTAGESFAPTIDVIETNEGLELHADLPGIKTSDLHVEVEGDVLILRGERKDEKATSGATYHAYERKQGTFTRSFKLPAHIDTSDVKAKYTDGVLVVRLPKRPESKPKTIKVE